MTPTPRTVVGSRATAVALLAQAAGVSQSYVSTTLTVYPNPNGTRDYMFRNLLCRIQPTRKPGRNTTDKWVLEQYAKAVVTWENTQKTELA